MAQLPEIEETHIQGHLSVENADIVEYENFQDCSFGIQTSEDGRVWICINGIAWLRFKPHRK